MRDEREKEKEKEREKGRRIDICREVGRDRREWEGKIRERERERCKGYIERK